jgi:hypothetical protein
VICTVSSEEKARVARDENFAALARCGHWISLGQASGGLQPISPDWLVQKSATFSRPVVFDCVATPAALAERAQRLWAALAVDGRGGGAHELSPPPCMFRPDQRGKV